MVVDMNTEIERIERDLYIQRHISPLTKFENADTLLTEVKRLRAELRSVLLSRIDTFVIKPD